ncbi:hypothetical protein CYMTET_11782 [Cymbomonas tetramitiformis]|uniref:Acyl-coenzyme A thioesterase THEM4 n=1 Tax=Cymbomonas tetramitiformis TaxID=36881 RepID=A0AAE0GLW7_9CHLO|nr:hypothetical protein CYMTET_11782 [Cymbomonas tetramitiformis]|eukprot:gene4684-5733_t
MAISKVAAAASLTTLALVEGLRASMVHIQHRKLASQAGWMTSNEKKEAEPAKLATEKLATIQNAAANLNMRLPASTSGVHFNVTDAPAWLRPLFDDATRPAGKRILMREWEDIHWRQRSGWRGVDLIHDPQGQGVQVLAYFWDSKVNVLTGITRFGPAAESHRGLCHGGSMTSLMDDLCGHITFFHGPSPWCGATVQVDCTLAKPVKVGDVLKLSGTIDRVEGKKVFISATLSAEDGTVHATMSGLSISPVVMSNINDAVDNREWLAHPDVILDSGWLLP